MRKANLDRVIALVPPEVGHATLPHEWSSMDNARRIEVLTGRSLDNCKEILDFPMEAAAISPTVMSGKTTVIRAILSAVTRVGLQSQRLQSMQDELLQGIIDDFAEPIKQDEFADTQAHSLATRYINASPGDPDHRPADPRNPNYTPPLRYR